MCFLNFNLAFSDNHFFLILYKELFYRDFYTRSQRGPSLQYRYGSYVNYQELFSQILYQSQTPIRAQLPNLVIFPLIYFKFLFIFSGYGTLLMNLFTNFKHFVFTRLTQANALLKIRRIWPMLMSQAM